MRSSSRWLRPKWAFSKTLGSQMDKPRKSRTKTEWRTFSKPNLRKYSKMVILTIRRKSLRWPNCSIMKLFQITRVRWRRSLRSPATKQSTSTWWSGIPREPIPQKSSNKSIWSFRRNTRTKLNLSVRSTKKSINRSLPNAKRLARISKIILPKLKIKWPRTMPNSVTKMASTR